MITRSISLWNGFWILRVHIRLLHFSPIFFDSPFHLLRKFVIELYYKLPYSTPKIYGPMRLHKSFGPLCFKRYIHMLSVVICIVLSRFKIIIAMFVGQVLTYCSKLTLCHLNSNFLLKNKWEPKIYNLDLFFIPYFLSQSMK